MRSTWLKLGGITRNVSRRLLEKESQGLDSVIISQLCRHAQTFPFKLKHSYPQSVCPKSGNIATWLRFPSMKRTYKAGYRLPHLTTRFMNPIKGFNSAILLDYSRNFILSLLNPPPPCVKSTTQQKLLLNSSPASLRLRGHQRLSRAARVTASLAASYCWVTTSVFGVWAAVLRLAVRDGTGWRLHYLGCFPSARTGTGSQVAVEIQNAPEGDLRVVSCHYLRGLGVLHKGQCCL